MDQFVYNCVYNIHGDLVYVSVSPRHQIFLYWSLAGQPKRRWLFWRQCWTVALEIG